MNHFNVFVFVVGFFIAFELVLCLGTLKKFTHLGLGKQDAFGNESREYLEFNGTKRNGKFTGDRNDSQTAKRDRLYLPSDVIRRNDNFTSPEIIIKKSLIFADVNTNKRNVTRFRRRSSHLQGRNGMNTTDFVKHGKKERVPSSLTRKKDKERATEHGQNDSSTLTPTYASARSNFSEDRDIMPGFKPSYKISNKDTNVTYRSLDLVLKVIKVKSFIKLLPERRKMTCCAKKVMETFPAVNLTLPSGNFSWVFPKAPVQIKTPQPLIQVMVVKPPMNSTIHKTESLEKVFSPWERSKPVLIKCPRSMPVFDQKTKTCKPTTSAPTSRVRIAISLALPGDNDTILNGSRKGFKECTALQKFEKNEYAVLGNNDPAVYIKKTGEVLQKQEYFRNETSANDSQAIFVCRLPQISNCSGVYILIKEGEFRVLVNKSIFVNASKQVYDWSEYTWINKSVLVCENFSNTYYKSTDDPVLTTITIVCMSLSIIGLVFVLVTYSLFSELRTPPGINLMNLSVSILLVQLLWLLGSGQTDTPMACTVIAVILHYLFLVSFVWTSIIVFDTWRAFSAKERRPLADSRSERMKHCLRHMAVGWLPMIIYVAVCITLDDMNIAAIGYGSVYGCWIMHYHAKLYFFGVPVLALILFNLVFYSMTIKVIRETRSQTRLIGTEHKRDIWIYVRVGALMGFTWIFGFAAPFGWQFLWYPFVVLNSLQGVYIALAFGVNKRARRLYNGLAKRKKQEKEKGVCNYERSTKQSAVVLELQGVTPTPL